MKNYTPDQVARLGDTRRSGGSAPYQCPACGEQQARIVVYPATYGGVTKTMGYAWCRACRRYTGWTSVYSPDSRGFLDGLTESQRKEFLRLSDDDAGEDPLLDSFFAYLDELTAD